MLGEKYVLHGLNNFYCYFVGTLNIKFFSPPIIYVMVKVIARHSSLQHLINPGIASISLFQIYYFIPIHNSILKGEQWCALMDLCFRYRVISVYFSCTNVTFFVCAMK